jgi:hypothetical protein
MPRTTRAPAAKKGLCASKTAIRPGLSKKWDKVAEFGVRSRGFEESGYLLFPATWCMRTQTISGTVTMTRKIFSVKWLE